jgi:hypothetical protein
MVERNIKYIQVVESQTTAAIWIKQAFKDPPKGDLVYKI